MCLCHESSAMLAFIMMQIQQQKSRVTYHSTMHVHIVHMNTELEGSLMAYSSAKICLSSTD